MRIFCEELLQALESQLSAFPTSLEEDPIRNCEPAMRLFMDGYEQLRNAFLEHPCNQEDEIHFFKYWKPRLSSRLLYFQKLYRIEAKKPVGCEKDIRRYYSRELRKTDRFRQKNATFYHYYQKGQSHLDDKLFLRNQSDYMSDCEHFHFQMDPLFATSHDYKAAQLLANEQVQNYLLARLQKRSQLPQKPVLQWTGSKVGLVELAYALHAGGVFNHGAPDIREIMLALGKAFDVEIGQFHRTFHEICNRKSERTKFLAGLNEKLLRRMELADEK